jgi:hypothetical protein
MQAKVDEEAGRLVQLRQNIEQEWAGRTLAGGACHRARDIQRRIVDNARTALPPAVSGSGQDLAAAAMLLRTMPEPSTTEGRRIQGELKDLLEGAAVRRAESSAFRRRANPSELGASHGVLLTHAGGLGPSRAHTGRGTCRQGSPRQ